jgi:hypothetical protein
MKGVDKLKGKKRFIYGNLKKAGNLRYNKHILKRSEKEI